MECNQNAWTHFRSEFSTRKQVKKKKNSYQCKYANSFRGTGSTFARPQSLRSLSVGTLKILIYTAETANEDTLHKRIFYVSQTIHNRPRPFEREPTVLIRYVRTRQLLNWERVL